MFLQMCPNPLFQSQKRKESTFTHAYKVHTDVYILPAQHVIKTKNCGLRLFSNRLSDKCVCCRRSAHITSTMAPWYAPSLRSRLAPLLLSLQIGFIVLYSFYIEIENNIKVNEITFSNSYPGELLWVCITMTYKDIAFSVSFEFLIYGHLSKLNVPYILCTKQNNAKIPESPGEGLQLLLSVIDKLRHLPVLYEQMAIWAELTGLFRVVL